MADEEKKEEAPPEGDAGAEGAKPSLIKKLLNPKILIPLVLVVGIGAGAGVGLILGKKNEPPPAAEGEGAKGKEGEAKQGEGEAKHGEGEKPKEGEAKSETPPPVEELPAEDEPGDTGGGAEPPEGEINEALLIKFDPVVVNIFEKNSIHYLKLQLQFKMSNEESVAEVNTKKAMLRDKLLFIISDTTLREVLSTGGKTLLKEDIQHAFNKILKKGKVEYIYFTDFTIQ
ncbi:flagellar basal body-associated FliL family protein [bacterium]|nr:flagellar basal body-associated FliL family protein [bacterium]